MSRELSVRNIERYGWRPDTPDMRDRIYNVEERLTSDSATLPVTFTLNGEPAVYNQLALGSCTGNGVAGALEIEADRQGEPMVTPSRLFIYYGEREIEGTIGEDSGAEIRDGIKVVAALGAPPESVWPYDISQFAVKPSAAAYEQALQHKAIQYQRVLPGTPGSPIRTPLIRGSAVVFGFTVYEQFEDGSWNPASDLLPLPSSSEGVLGGHCVCIVGWDFSLKHFPYYAFKCRNSWGPDWGDGGHFYMDARWFWDRSLGLTSDFWVITQVQ